MILRNSSSLPPIPFIILHRKRGSSRKRRENPPRRDAPFSRFFSRKEEKLLFFWKTKFAPLYDIPRYRGRVSQRCSPVLIGRAHERVPIDLVLGRGAQVRYSARPSPEQFERSRDNSREPIFLLPFPPLGDDRRETKDVKKRNVRGWPGQGCVERVMTATSASVPRSLRFPFQSSSLLTRRPTLNGLRRARSYQPLVALPLSDPLLFPPK